VAVAKESYTQAMEEVCGGTKPYMSTEHITAEHERVRFKAVLQFDTKKKMGGEEFSETYKQQLEKVDTPLPHKNFLWFLILNQNN